MIKKLALLFTILSIYCITQAQDIYPLYKSPNITVLPIPVREAWTSTGIIISSGDSVTILMDGIATTDYYVNNNYGAWIGPEGDPGLFPNGLLIHGVIGKIGSSGTPFNVGKSLGFVALKSDTLFLGYSDDQFDDNYGYYLAYISKIGGGLTSTQNYPETTPSMFKVNQNYPNPFNPNTNIEYRIVKQGNVEIEIYDINGRLVKSLLNTTQYPGSYTIQWNGQDDGNKTVASGTYFYQVKSNGVQLVKKMLLLK
jgi:hypothetical protein